MTLHPDVQTFANMLRDIAALLDEHGHTRWAEQIKPCIAAVERSDAYGVRRFLTFYGSMGSLNDVVLFKNGAPLTAENNRLQALLQEAYELGHCLEREEP